MRNGAEVADVPPIPLLGLSGRLPSDHTAPLLSFLGSLWQGLVRWGREEETRPGPTRGPED